MEKVIIPDTYHGLRIDKALALLFPNYSRAQLTALLKAQKISVNGTHPEPKQKVCGEEIVYCDFESLPRHETRLMAEAMPLDIAYEDDDCLVVNKPAGLVVHPGAGNPLGTLVQGLFYHNAALTALPRAGIIHRLDKDTTGLLLVAKNECAYTALTRQMQARSIERRYLALVLGHVICGGEIQTGYGRCPKNRLKMTVGQYDRQAITRYSVKQHFKKATLLEVKLETGRTHQIRVHMAYIKHPIIGDPLYGDRGRALSATLDFKRQALHAYTLSFESPSTQESITVKAPLPDDFQNLLEKIDET